MSEVNKTTEPQSKLTKQFTEAEWTALRALRSELPDVFTQVYPEPPPTSTTVWGIQITASPDNADPRASVVLVKFLRARGLNVEEAKQMLVNTLKWRDLTFKVHECLEEDFPEEIFGGIAVIGGKDKLDQPVVYNLYGSIKDMSAVFGDVDRFLRWRVAVQERTVMQLDFENIDQAVQIHDYAGVQSRTPESKKAASSASSIFTDHYPELLHSKYFLSVPTIMTWVFWAFKPILPAATFAKMSVVGAGKETIKKALVQVIDEEQIPQRYGGGLDIGV